MTSEVQVCVNNKKWAKNHLEQIAKKEAFLNNLKGNINNLTKDIDVGTRFVSTIDYDGNLYECKYAPHEEYLQREIYLNIFNDEGKISDKKLQHSEKIIHPVKMNITQILTFYSQKRKLINGEDYILYDEKLEDMFNKSKDMTLTLDSTYINAEVLSARSTLNQMIYGSREDIDEEYPNQKEITFIAELMSVSTRYEYDADNNPIQKWMTIFGYGYFPQIQYKASRILVRKCNLIAEAVGKNIDSSRKSINFTLKRMNVRNMICDEIDKLNKIRKIYNTRNPEKARSATLRQLTEEQVRLEPTLNRLEALFNDLHDIHIVSDAYYCKKYGYLIPFRATVVLDLSGNTFEKELEVKNKESKENIEKQAEQRREVVADIVPAVYHPDRVEKHVEKYGIEGVFGEDKVIVNDYTTGKYGVINDSVLG